LETLANLAEKFRLSLDEVFDLLDFATATIFGLDLFWFVLVLVAWLVNNAVNQTFFLVLCF
jgi:hypothetical protein